MTWVQRNKVWAGTALLVLAAAYVFYFINPNIAVSMFSNAWFLAVPLVLGAMVGVIGERSGVVNIGIEGQMLVGAFAGFFAAAAAQSVLVGVIVGALSGIAMGAFLAFTTVKGQLDQIIAGVVINIVATGITSFYYESGKTIPRGLPNFDVPLLSKIPLIGPVFFSDGPIALFALVIAFVLHLLLFKTRWGLRTRAVGEYPSAADTAGINVIGLRLFNVTAAGTLAGIAGAYLSMEATSTFERGMSSGRGFLALAILIFGAWRPLRALAAALFFGFMSASASQLQASNVVDIPQQFINLLPYVLTLVVLAAAAGRVRAPGAVGQPFVKGD
ncbi:ABC transporter permease [Knoellia sp. CPCC 206450]|uniref:ABC transporter permease n=1 Tax=Knoellia tibetensis TaxID=3404798 RepID=UPI003B439E58